MCEFFRDHRLCGSQDANGETIINTLAHNPRCIQAHKDVSVPYNPPPPSPDTKKESTTTTDSKQPEIAIAVDKPLEVDTDVATTMSSLLSGTNTSLGTTGMGIFGTQLTSSTPLTSTSSTSTSSAVTVPPPLNITDPPLAFATPPLKSPLWRPFGPDVDPKNTPAEEPSIINEENKGDQMETTITPSSGIESTSDEADKMKKVTFAVEKIQSSEDIQEDEIHADVENLAQPSTTTADLNESLTDSTEPAQTTDGEKSSTVAEDDKTATDETDGSDKPDSPLSAYIQVKDCCPSCGLYTHDDILGYDMLRATFRNWQCICTSILGFNPFHYIDSDLPFPKPSSIKTLDNFVTNMVVNCDSGLIVGITGTTTTEMNNALEKGIDIRPVLEADDNLEGMDKSNLSLYVGVRFIRSIVRVLMLEHSRVKSSVAEVQLSREGRNRNSQLQMRSKIVQQVLK